MNCLRLNYPAPLEVCQRILIRPALLAFRFKGITRQVSSTSAASTPRPIPEQLSMHCNQGELLSAHVTMYFKGFRRATSSSTWHPRVQEGGVAPLPKRRN